MGLNKNHVNFNEIKKDFFLRLDFDYFDIKKKLNIDNYIKLRKYLTFLETGKPISQNDYVDISDNIHIVVRNIADGKFNNENLIYINDDKGIELQQYRLKKGDIVIAISSNCGNSFYYNWNDKRNLTLSHYLARFRINYNYINPVYLNYYINSSIIKKYFRSVETGKTLKNLSKYYIKTLPLLIPDLNNQNKIVSYIEPIEEKITKLKSIIIPQYKIINEILSKELDLNDDLYNEFGKGMTAGTQNSKEKTLRKFNVNFREFSKSNILRFSTRYHNLPTKKLMNILLNMNTLQVKDILTEDIHRGTNPDYDNDGEIPVIKTGHLKNEYIEISTEEFVNESFYSNTKRSVVKENDILLTSTGKISLGKIDLLETDDKLVADGHISIIRIDEKKYNRKFFVCFFRYVLGYFQVERDYTGSTNQIDLYKDEISQFLIPDISLKKQEIIVKKIDDLLSEQNKIKKQIEKEIKKIDDIIMNSLVKKH